MKTSVVTRNPGYKDDGTLYRELGMAPQHTDTEILCVSVTAGCGMRTSKSCELAPQGENKRMYEKG